jgi:integrase
MFKPALTKAGLSRSVRFHDLRHTCAALCIALGAHPKAIQERLGHSSITVTLDRYGHLFPKLDEALTDRLDELHSDAVNQPATRR